jgi:hypothetical protein
MGMALHVIKHICICVYVWIYFYVCIYFYIASRICELRARCVYILHGKSICPYACALLHYYSDLVHGNCACACVCFVHVYGHIHV